MNWHRCRTCTAHRRCLNGSFGATKNGQKWPPPAYATGPTGARGIRVWTQKGCGLKAADSPLRAEPPRPVCRISNEPLDVLLTHEGAQGVPELRHLPGEGGVQQRGRIAAGLGGLAIAPSQLLRLHEGVAVVGPVLRAVLPELLHLALQVPPGLIILGALLAQGEQVRRGGTGYWWRGGRRHGDWRHGWRGAWRPGGRCLALNTIMWCLTLLRPSPVARRTLSLVSGSPRAWSVATACSI